MPCSYQIIADSRLVYVSASGIVRGEDLLALWREVVSDVAFSPSFRCLMDYSKVESTDLHGPGVSALAQMPPPFSDGARRAVVVRSDLGYGLVRMFQSMRDQQGDDMEIFRSVQEARDWLGLAKEISREAEAP